MNRAREAKEDPARARGLGTMAAQGQELWQACLDGERARALSLLDEDANIEHEGGSGATHQSWWPLRADTRTW